MPWPTDAPVRLAPWLIPNPVNPYVPQLERDVSKHPSTARRVTGAHVTGSSDKKTSRSCLQRPSLTPRIFLLIDSLFHATSFAIKADVKPASCHQNEPFHDTYVRCDVWHHNGRSMAGFPAIAEATPSTALVQKL
ncbi:hypothetical protein PISMIDRAFT_18509 [Pisolithus microcarpus 441]|uniref:Uncharacterized protein n=1 Tax=Pisolithus microcarpus 441 TaxID=765257 RepID=A0A0C9XK89_9AGAM|nr:hypothetical protein PISMIDRAFT_18509 [Pisolithus microcarpus 441]